MNFLVVSLVPKYQIELTLTLFLIGLLFISILNKLTPEKFDKLCLELLNVGVDSKLVLKGIVLLVSVLFNNPLLVYITFIFYYLSAFNCNLCFHWKIVDKALEEPKYSQLYAQLCQRLAEDVPNFEDLSTESQTVQKQNSVWLEVIIGFTFQLIAVFVPSH